MRSPCKRQRVSPAAAPEAYPLPAALLDEKSEPKPIYEPWPARALVFKCWPVSICGDRDAMVVDELLSRGWVDGGLPCNPDDVGELPLVLSGKHPTRALPRRALWIPTNAAEVKVLHEAFAVDKRLAARFCVGGIPSSGLACFKTYTARAVGAEPFVPLTFVLPAQRAELLVADAALRKSKAEPILWVGKPKCNYAGRGITVTVRVEDVADGAGVVQRFGHNFDANLTKAAAFPMEFGYPFEREGAPAVQPLISFGFVVKVGPRIPRGSSDLYATGSPRLRFFYPAFGVYKHSMRSDAAGDITGQRKTLFQGGRRYYPPGNDSKLARVYFASRPPCWDSKCRERTLPLGGNARPLQLPACTPRFWNQTGVSGQRRTPEKT